MRNIAIRPDERAPAGTGSETKTGRKKVGKSVYLLPDRSTIAALLR